jgi:hypothetical protein
MTFLDAIEFAQIRDMASAMGRMPPQIVNAIEKKTGINIVKAVRTGDYEAIKEANKKLSAWKPVAVKIFESTPEAVWAAKKLTGVDVVEVLTHEENADGIVQNIIVLIAIGVALMVYGIVLGNLESPLKDAIPDNSSFSALETDTPAQLANAGKIATVIPIIAIAAVIIGIVYRLM